MLPPEQGVLMIDDMGIFRTTLSLAALATPDDRRDLLEVLVDTGERIQLAANRLTARARSSAGPH